MPRLTAHDLRCEYATNPTAVDCARPRLSWKLKSDDRGAFQTHYRILAATKPELLREGAADLWDSGYVPSEETLHVPYAGAALSPWQTAWWTVQSLDDQAALSEWAEPACWSADINGDPAWDDAPWMSRPDTRTQPETLELGDGLWLGEDGPKERAVCLRRTFEVDEPAALDAAILQAHSNYWSMLWINGVHVGQSVVWGHISHYDVKEHLKPGENVLAVMAGANSPHRYVTVALELQSAGKAVLRVATDKAWKARLGNGPDWRDLDFDDADWGAPDVVIPGAEGPWRGRRAMPEFLPAGYYRRKFQSKAKVARARLAVCGLGYFEAFVNGQRIGDHRLDPGQTDYDKRAFHVVHDVTKLVGDGDNAVGLILADGFFNQEQTWGGLSYGLPRAKACLRIEYEDGEVENIVSGSSWTCGDGPIKAAAIYSGEIHDAREEVGGWAEPGFDASGWQAAQKVEGPEGETVAQMLPPIREIETVKPVGLTFPTPDVAVFNIGQNLPGVARLRVRGKAGERIRLRFAEALDPRGFCDYESTGIFATNFIQEDVYICKGDGVETWEPRFTYHGFQYIEMIGWSEKPTLESLEVVVLHTDAPNVGEFECSDAFVNKVHEAARWTMRSNMHSVPTDCPARERCGWLGDAQVDAEMSIYNFDMPSFWRKYLRDIETSLTPAGLPTMVAPGKRRCGDAVTDWGCALPMVNWYMYLYYGDVAAADEHYPSMVRFVEHLDSLSADGIVENGLGDWCYPSPEGNEKVAPHNAPPEQVPLTSTLYYIHCLDILADFSQLLGKPRAAELYRTRSNLVREKFNARFYNADSHTYGSQTVDSMALFMGVVPSGEEAALGAAIASDVRARGNHFTTGIHGLRHLFWALCEGDASATALDCLKVEGYPGFAHLFDLGATTIWERWGEGWHDHRDAPFYSMNHPMQAGVDAWLYNGVGGVCPSEDEAGFKRVILRPHFVEGLDWANVDYESIRGTIRSSWSRKDGKLDWEITLPANTSGLVYLPVDDPASVREGDTTADDAEFVELLLHSEGVAIYEVGAGTYRFSVPEKQPAAK